VAVLAAPDAFKGTFAARAVAQAMERGALRTPGASCVTRPLADGGEGTLDALTEPLALTHHQLEVGDPLGRPVPAAFGLAPDSALAVVEAARASGMERLEPDELQPWRATSYGTGQLIAAAARAGARRVLVGAGGVATVDGGAGALAALDDEGVPRSLELVVLCDVTTPWERAAPVFGPQKGADADMVSRLARRLDAMAHGAPRDPRGVALTGAAGGLSGGLWAFRGAELARGAPYILDRLGIDRRLAAVDLVLTGEGCLDGQTAEGKLVAELARRAAAAGCRVEAIVGRCELSPARQRALGLSRVSEATTLAAIADCAAHHVATLQPRLHPDDDRPPGKERPACSI
jgi:glycerate kinase